MEAFLEFEKPIVHLEKKLIELRELAKQGGMDFSDEIKTLENKVQRLIEETFAKLTPWQKVQLSRHPNRPYARDYIDALFVDFMELHGDRCFGDDGAIIGGIGLWPFSSSKKSSPEWIPVMIIAHQKGRTTKQKMERNFGMARPEGYRKAMRLMDIAHRCKMPIVTLIDTPGAYPGADAEQRGQSQAIAESIHRMFAINTPCIAIVIGEGGSGGALAIGIADRVLMQEYGTYSVISPESCASILWSDSGLAEKASEKLRMNPPDLLKMKVIDGIIPEPQGGAHRNWEQAQSLMREALIENLTPLIKEQKKKPDKDWSRSRAEKFRSLGDFAIASKPSEPENHA